MPLWDLRGVPGVHELVWGLSFISFFFLYPSTFNLLEIAAVDEPKVHLYETGIIRVTRHPQARVVSLNMDVTRSGPHGHARGLYWPLNLLSLLASDAYNRAGLCRRSGS